MMLQWLQARGHWDRIGSMLRVRREGGFVGVDVVLFLLLFFGAGSHRSLKRFGQWTAPFRKELAALGGRVAFATPSSVSRFLGAVEFSDVRAMTQWLLCEACDANAVLQHPAAAAYDTHGRPWHVFDWDGTVTPFRHRALPSGSDLPPPDRRSAQTGSAGYPGRKRGDIQFMRATLQHAGSGLWLDAVLSPGRNDTASMLRCALDAIAVTCRNAGLPTERVVLRADGCGGNVPFLTACRSRGVPFLVRSAHYSLLEDPSVHQALQQATWHEVPSSGSGPTRFAAELGDLLLQPSKATMTVDGERFEPIRVRMVASRFAASEKSGSGCVINGWQFELYATDLSASAWPAPETVELYYGRCGQENRFAQEDRELALDRTFSYHLPGQELATVVGLFLWNWRTVIGFADNPPPVRAPKCAPRRPIVAEPLCAPDGGTLDDEASQSPTVVDSTQVVATAVEAAVASDPAVSASEPGLQELMAQLPWNEITSGLPPNWKRAETGDALVCHEGALLPARAITPARQGRATRIEFLAALSSCRSCNAENRCIDAIATGTAKKVTRAISTELADALYPLLTNNEAKRARRDREAERRRIAAPSDAKSAPSPRIARDDDPPGPFTVVPPLLLPAALRRAARDAFASLRIRIEVEGSMPDREMSHPALATSSAERQKRRRTWHERLQSNALGHGACVSIYLVGDPAVVSRHLPGADVLFHVA